MLYSESMISPARRIFRFFSSLPLAIGLLIGIAIYVAIGSFIPQGLPGAEYDALYGPTLGIIVRGLGFSSMFHSPIFFILSIAFGLNLFLCTVARLLSGKQKTLFAYGPDAIHIGLLLFLLGAVLSAVGRREDALSLRVGESFTLQSQYELTLNDTQELRDANDIVIDWHSEFRIRSVLRDEDDRYALVSTNNPLRVAGTAVYQLGWDRVPTLVLRGDDGALLILQEGEGLSNDRQTIMYQNGRIEVFVGEELAESRELKRGDRLFGLEIADMRREATSSVLVTRDPGVPWAMTGFGFMVLGFVLYLIHKAPRKLINGDEE